MDRALVEDTELSIGTVVPHRALVRIRDGQVRFVKVHHGQADESSVIAQAPATEVTYTRPKLTLVGRIRVDLGAAGSWTASPAQRGGPSFSRNWAGAFAEALVESGATRR